MKIHIILEFKKISVVIEVLKENIYKFRIRSEIYQ